MYPRKQVPFNLNEYLEPVDPWLELAKKLNNNYGPREDSPAEEPAVMGTPEMQGRGIASEDANLDTAAPAPREAVEFTPEQEAEIARSNAIAEQALEEQFNAQAAQDMARVPTQETATTQALSDGKNIDTRQMQTGLSPQMQQITGEEDDEESRLDTFRKNLGQLSMDPWAKLIDFMAGKGKLSGGKALEDKAAMQKERLNVYQGEKLTNRVDKVIGTYLDFKQTAAQVAEAFRPEVDPVTGEQFVSATKIETALGLMSNLLGQKGAQSDKDLALLFKKTLGGLIETLAYWTGLSYKGRLSPEAVKNLSEVLNKGAAEIETNAYTRLASLERMYLSTGVSPETITAITEEGKSTLMKNPLQKISLFDKKKNAAGEEITPTVQVVQDKFLEEEPKNKKPTAPPKVGKRLSDAQIAELERQEQEKAKANQTGGR